MSLLADVLPSPTLVLDPLYLGWPALVVFPAIVAAAVLAGRAVRRRGKGRGAAVAVGVVVFVALDVVVYLVAISTHRGRPRGAREFAPGAAEVADPPGLMKQGL